MSLSRIDVSLSLSPNPSLPPFHSLKVRTHNSNKKTQLAVHVTSCCLIRSPAPSRAWDRKGSLLSLRCLHGRPRGRFLGQARPYGGSRCIRLVPWGM